MAIQPILQGDIPALRQISEEITAYDDKLHGLINDLADTLEANRGLGLAAPQIGVHRRVFVIDVGMGVQEFVNPEIVDESGEIEGYESCLSFPDHTLCLKRPQFVTIIAKDRFGKPLRLEAEGLLARIICHEVDHLNGILFMDHLDEEELFMQLLGNSDIVLDDHAEEQQSPAETSAKLSECQMIVDTLAELSWKLVLCLEMLEDYREDVTDVVDLEELAGASNIVQRAVNQLENIFTND